MKSTLKRIVPLILVIGIIASIGWYLLVYDRDFTRDILIRQARLQDTRGNDSLASWFYDLAYEISDKDDDVAIELAEQYKASGNYTKAEYTLTNAIADGGTADLYIALCKTYVEQDKLLDAVNMLNNIANGEIKAQLDAMRPAAPTADPEPGYYSQYITVTLTAEEGTLYCTTDGQYPSIQDAPYSEGYTLPAGETTIYAIAVADSGLVSPLSVLGYTVAGVIEEVTLSDPAIDASVREILEVDADAVLMSDQLWEITDFTVPQGAESLEDLARLSYLQTLTIEDMELDSLAPLASLSSLISLRMSNCRFPTEDLSILAGLPSLEHLTMHNCGLSTIADLAGAQHLTYLDVSTNTLRNLEVLSDMTTLAEINLQHNAVVSLSALNTLTNLEKLDVSYNSITAINTIPACKKLSWLDVTYNSLTSLDGVASLTSLTYLAAASNDLTDISVLGQCTGLTELYLSSNTISDISALGTLTALETLDFSYNEVEELPTWPDGSALMVLKGSYNLLTSIESLSNQENLTYVYLDYNQLTSVDSIADCFHLVMVSVYGNKISDVSALTDHNIIVNYDPTQ